MGRYASYSTRYEYLYSLSIADLKRLGYLKKGQLHTIDLSWNNGTEEAASITLGFNSVHLPFCIELNYQYNGQHLSYTINLETQPSNLGKGNVWYFRCIYTGKLCRKLYLIDGYFVHRTAVSGIMYASQTYSQATRAFRKPFIQEEQEDKAYRLIVSKHFKKYYKGQHTKRFLKLLCKYNLPPDEFK